MDDRTRAYAGRRGGRGSPGRGVSYARGVAREKGGDCVFGREYIAGTFADGAWGDTSAPCVGTRVVMGRAASREGVARCEVWDRFKSNEARDVNDGTRDVHNGPRPS